MIEIGGNCIKKDAKLCILLRNFDNFTINIFFVGLENINIRKLDDK
jgi:hypothetical protein